MASKKELEAQEISLKHPQHDSLHSWYMTSHNNFGKMRKALNKVQSTIRDVKKATLFVLFFH